jgi:hypothetical protein
MRVGQSRKRDANERAICAALHRIGVQTYALSIPGLGDLLAWRADTGWRVLECKTPRGRLTKAQRAVHTHVPIQIVRSVDEALALYGKVEGRSAGVRAALLWR